MSILNVDTRINDALLTFTASSTQRIRGPPYSASALLLLWEPVVPRDPKERGMTCTAIQNRNRRNLLVFPLPLTHRSKMWTVVATQMNMRYATAASALPHQQYFFIIRLASHNRYFLRRACSVQLDLTLLNSTFSLPPHRADWPQSY